MARHENCGGEIVGDDPMRCSGCSTVGYGAKRLPDGTTRLYPIGDIHRLEREMWEIIERRWEAETNPVGGKSTSKPHIYSEEIYNELIAKGVDIPDGEMYKIFSKWQRQRMEAIEFAGAGQEQHGDVKIIGVYPRIG